MGVKYNEWQEDECNDVYLRKIYHYRHRGIIDFYISLEVGNKYLVNCPLLILSNFEIEREELTLDSAKSEAMACCRNLAWETFQSFDGAYEKYLDDTLDGDD